MALAGTRLHLVELCSIAAPENVCKCSADEVARTCATRRFRALKYRRVLQIAAARPTRVLDNSAAETSTLPACCFCGFIF